MRVLFLSFFVSMSLFASNEADEFLEQHESSSLEKVREVFLAKGGTILRLENGAPPFSFLRDDMVFPACSGGNNRSQTLWNLLRPYADKITLMAPHGTRYGFDPYNGQANWQRTFHFYHNDEFILWAGVSKTKKFGWDRFDKFLSQKEASAETLNEMKDYYSDYYYGRNLPSDVRRVYITFTKNAHVHLYRLNEVNESLKNVVVLLFPVDDCIFTPLETWNTYPYSHKAYTELATILQAYLDLSQL